MKKEILVAAALLVCVALHLNHQHQEYELEQEVDGLDLQKLAAKEKAVFATTQSKVEAATGEIRAIVTKLKKQELAQTVLVSRGKQLHHQLRKIANLPNQLPFEEVQKELDAVATKVRKLIVDARNAHHAQALTDGEMFNSLQSATKHKDAALATLHSDQLEVERLPALVYDKLMRITHPLKVKLRAQRDVFAAEALRAKLLSHNAESIDSVASDMGKLLMSVYKTESNRKRKPWDF